MKKLFFALAVIFLAASCSQSYTVKGLLTGNIDSLDSTEVYISNYSRTNLITDTTLLVKGEFTFKGNVSTPQIYYLTVKGVPGKVQFFLENADITIKTPIEDLSKAEIVGGPTQVYFNKEKEVAGNLSEKYDIENIVKEYQQKETTEARKKEIIASYDNFQSDLKEAIQELIDSDSTSYYALNNLEQNYRQMEYTEIIDAVKPFQDDKKFENNLIVKSIEESIALLAKVQIGQKAPEISFNTPEGNKLALSEVYSKNKITLIDFWASWCGGCRQFNPILRGIYNDNHDNGFEVFAVSFDQSLEAWKKGIKDDQITWPQVSDLKGWQCAAASVYSIFFIPQNVVVDSEGTIIARRVDENQLRELLKNNL
ncbi:MAG: TlpA disulfide reductase family protein [Bacteroidales bacterium]